MCRQIVGRLLNSELESMRKEAGVAYCQVLTNNLSVGDGRILHTAPRASTSDRLDTCMPNQDEYVENCIMRCFTVRTVHCV